MREARLAAQGALSPGPSSTALSAGFPPKPHLDVVMRQAENLLGHQQGL